MSSKTALFDKPSVSITAQ